MSIGISYDDLSKAAHRKSNIAPSLKLSTSQTHPIKLRIMRRRILVALSSLLKRTKSWWTISFCFFRTRETWKLMQNCSSQKRRSHSFWTSMSSRPTQYSLRSGSSSSSSFLWWAASTTPSQPLFLNMCRPNLKTTSFHGIWHTMWFLQ